MNGKITYRQQFTRCGKQRCRKCQNGTGHGPYWYAYWSENGRTVSKYIGAKLPQDAELERVQQAQQIAHGIDNEFITIQSQDPHLPPTPTYSLKVYMLGQFRIERKQDNEWKPVDGRIWNRRRARSLLGCLLSHPGRRLGREQVMDMLWPDTEIEVAANRLNGAVHELRQLLEPELKRPANSRLLRLEHDILELADSNHIWVDAEAFEGLLREADTTTDPAQAKHSLEQAATLYQGHYLLEELYTEWAAQRRDTLQRAWVGLLLNLAEQQTNDEEYASAIKTLDRLRSADPTNETALQRLMTLLTRRDRRGEALKVYHQHVSMLQRDYESEPLSETIALYEKLRQGQLPNEIAPRTSTGNAMVLDTAHEPTATPQTETKQMHATATNAPVQPVKLRFKRPHFQPGRHNQSPLIGRDREIYTLRQMMLSLEEHTPSAATPAPSTKQSHFHPMINAAHKKTHFVLLRGESGIGKTRLAEELSMEAYHRGWAVAWSRSYEQESSIPYHPWAELLRAFYQNTSPLINNLNEGQPAKSSAAYEISTLPFKLERLSALLPDLIPNTIEHSSHSTPTIPHEQERLHLWEAALGLIDAYSRIHPLLLVLDDLHWADDSSIELLTYLIHHLQDQSVLFIGSSREGELSPQHKLRALLADLQREQAITFIHVQPLTNTQIGSLVAHLPKNIVENIQTQAVGNPFFAEELARYADMANSELDVPTLNNSQTLQGNSSLKSMAENSRTSTGTLPAAISAMLERRLSRLSSNCQTLLNKAAIIGGSFELRQLLPMTNDLSEDTVLDLLEEALDAGLLSEEGTGAHIVYHFWHPLIISFLYGRLTAARRAQLHRKAAEAMQIATNRAEKIAATIVYHLNKGGGDLKMLAHYAEIAGEQAYTLAAYGEARQHYLQVLQAQSGNDLYANTITDVQEQIRQMLNRVISHLQLPDPAYPDRPAKTCRILERIAECCIILGDFDEGRQLYEYILTLHASAPFQYYLNSSISDPAILQRIEAQTQALLWREISSAWAATSAYKEAHASYQQGKAVMQQAGVTSGAAWACLHLHYGALLRVDGNYDEARRYLQEALSMLEECVQAHPEHSPLTGQSNTSSTRIERALRGDPLDIGYAHERLGVVAAGLGEVQNALEHLHTTLKIYEQNELITEMARVCGNLGAVYALKGEHDEGRAYMRRALDLAERGGELPTMAFVSFNLGDVAQRSGELQESESWYKQSQAIAERVNDREGASWALVALASIQKDLGHLEEAVQSILRGILIAREIQNARCLQHASVKLAEIHIAQAISIQVPSIVSTTGSVRKTNKDQRQHLLRRARMALSHVTGTMTGVDIEIVIEGQLLLATIQFLLNDIEEAYQTAYQTLQDVLSHETTQLSSHVYLLLARIQGARDEHVQAEQYYHQALNIYQQYGFHLGYARALHYYGEYLVQPAIRHTRTTAKTRLPVQDERYQEGLDKLQEAQCFFEQSQAALDLALNTQVLTRLSTPSSCHNQFIPAN
jgi:DNA-binding SARP family transcriptional activator/tetratricopeptide (TPR) repeat protein